MRNKKFAGFVALVMFAVMVFAGQGYAVDSSSPYHVSKWETEAANTTMYSVFSDYYYVNSTEYTWRKFNSNCFYFARWVTNRLSNVDFKLQTLDMRGIVLYGGNVKGVNSNAGKSVGDIAQLLGQHLNDVSGTPTEQQVRNIFANAQVGDVIQFVGKLNGWYSVSQHTMVIAQKYDNGFDTLEGNNPKNTVRNNYLSYADFRNGIAAAGSVGGFSVYHFGTDPIPPEPDICEGLRNLTPSKYAKVYTAEWDQYNELYSNAELSNRLWGNYIAYHEECRIIGVGRNSSGTVYARIYFPLDNGNLKEGYVDLQKAFVPNLLNSDVKKNVAEGRNLYRRAAYETKIAYAGIAAGSDTYLLAEKNGWCVVLYETSRKDEWRIVWMTAEDYGSMFNAVPKITSMNNIPAQVVAGTYYSGSLTASGTTPITWKVSDGNPPSSASNYRKGFPPGLLISRSGTSSGARTTISGYPSHTSAGQSSFMPLYYFFNITATNAGGDSAPKSSYITVWEPPVFETSATLTRGDVGRYYNQTIRAKGTEWSMRWSIIEGKLPPGLSFNASDSKRTATITGYPQHTGVFKFKVRLYNLVGNSNTTTTREFTINVGNVANEYRDSRISFRYNVMNGKTGSSYSDWTGVNDSKSGTKSLSNYIFLVSNGELPPGLYLEEESSSYYSAGRVYLKGVPSKAGTYSFTIKAKRINDGGYNTKDFTVRIDSSSSSAWRSSSMYTSWYFTSGKMQVSYRDWIRVNGGTSPYTPSLVKGELPPGTRLEQSGAYTYLTGVPKQNGTFNFTVRITGSNGGYVEKACNVYIANNPYYKSGGSGSGKLKFSSKAMPDAYVGSMWEATLDASGTEPIAWSAVEPLPEWMTLEEDTGRVFGIPMEKGKYKFKIKIENEEKSVTKTFKVKVLRDAPSIVTSSLPDGYTGVAYEVYLEAQGTDPIKWSKVGKLPGGLKLNKKEGIISGTPKKDGTFSFTLKAKNKGGTETIPMTITIHKSAEEPSDKDDEEDDSDDDDDSSATETPTLKTSLPTDVSTQPESIPAQNGSANILTALYALSGDERLEGSVNAEAGKDIAFEIGAWTDEYGRAAEVSDVAVFIDDAPISADISPEGTFTVAGENVHGEFTVYAASQYEGRELRTAEISVSTFAREESASVSASGIISASGVEAENDSGSEAGASGGCSLSLLGVAGMLLCVNVIRGKKR